MNEIFVIVLVLGLCFGEETVSVNTKLGVINGKSVTVKFRDNEYVNQQFLGIPYARSPTGSLRFNKPEPAEKFDTPFDAFKFGSVCPQHDMMNFGLGSNDEDCLSLNIYIPTEPTSSPPGYAVMIFIHGGGFTMGAAKMLPGDVLSSYGNVILVTINYRLGIFGFASTGDDMAPGNVGLWDQRLAIQWVNENIEAFGGDPTRVTIFGESVGAMSVYMQALYPPNKGLFQNIIGQSGAPFSPLVLEPNNKASLSFVAGKVGCEQENFGEVFECLQTVDSELIMDTIKELSSDPTQHIYVQFAMTLDTTYFKESLYKTVKRIKEGESEEVDFLRTLNMINGVNSAEGASWLHFMQGASAEDVVVSHDDLKNMYIPSILQMFSWGKPATQLLHSMVEYEYTDWEHPDNARLQYVKFMGDIIFTAPGYDLSLVHANSTDSKSWMYIFDAPTEKNSLPKPAWVIGAQHGDDLLPVFGYSVDKEYAVSINASDYVPPGWELELSENMMTAWSNFAKYGDPNTKGSELLWPQFTIESQKQLRFGKDIPLSVQQYLYAKEHAFWCKLVPTIMETGEYEHAPVSPFTQKQSETCDAVGNCA